MSFACCVLANSTPLIDLQSMLKQFRPTSMSANRDVTVCIIETVTCVIRRVDVSSFATEQPELSHNTQLIVELVPTNTDSGTRQSQLMLAKLMTRLLTQICQVTDSVGVLWRNFLVHDMQMWNSWCQVEIPTALWLSVSQEPSELGCKLRTRGLDLFGQPEVCMESTPDPSDVELDCLRAFAEYLIVSDDRLSLDSVVEFSAVETGGDHLALRVCMLGKDEVAITRV